MGDMTKNFSRWEMECPCCHRCDMDPAFMTILQEARDIADIPFHINSGYRCEAHNASLPNSVSNSSHKIGQAVDIRALNSKARLTITSALIKAGFVRIKLYNRWIHADTDSSKPSGLFL